MAGGQLVLGDSDASEPHDQVAEALAAWGMAAETPIVLDEPFWLWPENESVFALWLAVQSQWTVSDGVRYKLDYPGVEVVMRMQEVNRREQARQFALLQVMENAALNEWARNRK